MNSILTRHYKIWQQKPILRVIYNEWYQKIVTNLSAVKGQTLEIGSGTGNFKDYFQNVITSDIDPEPWLDMHFDAHKIPFDNGSLSNIVMIDVLHHLSDPIKFLNEAHRVLNIGGRLIMIEPYPSFFSKFIYKLFHPEPFLYNIDYFSLNKQTKNKNPWESNQAISYLIFYKNVRKFTKLFNKKFKFITKDKFSFILYPLSGGFENRQLIPNFLIPVAKYLELFLRPFNTLLAFRCFVILEKQY
jgi:SAM-dependent methyltransferase